MKEKKEDVLPAIVVGGGLNALGVVRSLGTCNIPVIVVDTDPKSPAMRSRYGRKLVCASIEGEQFVEFMIGLAREYAAPLVLFATEEKTVETVSAFRERLAPHFRLRQPEHERLMALMHKQGFQELAEAVDAPVPRTVRLQGKADLARIGNLKYPCIFKPSKKDYGYGARFKKGYKVSSPEEVAALYEEIHPVLADMVVQEWIEGSDADVYFCLQYIGQDGSVVSSFSGRKIRAWPLRVGGTASCTSAWEVADELAAMTADFFRKVGFVGMGSMEYKRDERDGRFYMVEPTVGRTDFQEEVASLNGVNIPAAAYRHEMGLPALPQQRSARPRIWREPNSDRWAFQENGGQADARSAGHAVCDAYWRWNDPKPWIDMFAHRLGARFGRTA
ncbi:carboxylate--amine ligase [Massilia sp. LjRoot122]|uniref:carboxylate--amine ligase n=1 Tax=Massilia sp. LjRoot122 TaxID=3342257 RepID=UPI003ECCF51E